MDGVLEVRKEAVGCHVFAGGFTAGVKRVFDVKCQLELHDLGHRTAREVFDTPVVHARPEEWPARRAESLLYGNPRCTGFSVITAGYSSEAHGPFAKQCQDINDLMSYGLSQEFPVICWESVQQAYTTGKPLLDLWTERCVKAGKRVAHVFTNAATFGNAQNRKRYFYVAYPRELQFNADAPSVRRCYPVVYDAIWNRRGRAWRYFDPRSEEYDQDTAIRLSPDEEACVPHLGTGWCLNEMGKYGYDRLTPRLQRVWDYRNSDMPFSLHGITRTSWLRPSPTLTSTSIRLIHPWHDRAFTIGELADIMGWEGKVPVGPDPSLQIAKGVVPAVGEWVAQQIESCLDDKWGGDEWTCKFDHDTGEFVGEDSRGMNEKVIDLTNYYGHQFDIERFPDEAIKQQRKFNVCPKTGKLLKPWRLERDLSRV